MDYIIYTSEGFTQAEDGSDIENCQILDFQYNSPLTKQECKRNYLSIYSNNKTGLNDHELQIAIRISDDLCLAMRELITYITTVASMTSSNVSQTNWRPYRLSIFHMPSHNNTAPTGTSSRLPTKVTRSA